MGRKRRRLNPDMLITGDTKILDNIVHTAKEEQVDCLFILGDLFDSDDISSNIKEICLDKFSQLKETHIYIFPGNHDLGINLNSPQITFFNESMARKISDDITVYAYDHKKGLDLADWNEDKKSGFNIICGHLAVRELQLDKQRNAGISVSTHDIAHWKADLVLLGHDHNTRFLKQGNKILATYVGAPYNIYENELVARGVVICEIDKGQVNLRFRRLECPPEFKVKAAHMRTAEEINTRYGPVTVGEYTWKLIGSHVVNNFSM